MSSEPINNTAPATAPPTATCDPQQQQAPAPAAGVSTLPQAAPSQIATTQTPMQDQNLLQGQATMQGQNPQLPPLQTNVALQQPQQSNNLAPPMQQQWYPPPASPQYQNYSPSQGQPPAPFPQAPGYGQFPYYPPQQQQQQQQQPPYPQQQWQQNPASYGTGAYGYSQPPSPGYSPQQPAPYYPQYAPTTPVVGGSGLFPKSTIPYIPPTVGYNLSFVEAAPPQSYPVDHCNGDVDLIVKAFSSINTDEKILIQVLTSRSHPLEISSRKQAYRQRNSGAGGNAKELIDIVRNKDLNFSGGFKSLTHALVAGPLELDVFLLKEAMKGAGTNERLLDLVLLCRSNEDIKAIAQYYQKDHSRTLWQDLDGDLSGDMKILYQAVIRAERHWDDPSVPIPRDELEGNIKELLAALTGTVTISTVIKYFIYGSYHRLASINKEWKSVADCKETLEKRIEKKFRGHMEDALRYILTAATDRALSHAKLLEKSLNRMGGVLSNKQEEIAVQVAKIVWEDQLRVGSAKPSGGAYARGDYVEEVSARYRDEFIPQKDRGKKTLLNKLDKETSGHFNDFLVKLWKKR